MPRAAREPFPPDRGLQARMVLASVLTPVVAIAGFVLALLVLHGFQRYLFIGVAVVGVVALGVGLLRHDGEDVLLPADAEPELWAVIDRLCVAADLPRPEVVLDADRAPNSWVVDLPGKPPRLYVTRGLVQLLEPAELEAVIAHELAHVLTRDATVMTLVGFPGDAVRQIGFGGGAAGGFLFLIGAISRIGTASLSRHRELTADAGAAALTGRPSALASALLKIDGVLAGGDDLRGLGRPTLNLLPAGRLRWSERLAPFRTHPSVERRVAALERIERRLGRPR